MVFFIAWYVFLVIKIAKNKLKNKQQNIGKTEELNISKRTNSLYKVIWTGIGLILIVIITSFYGVKIYQSAINFNGKLSWFLLENENKRAIEFDYNNIYEYGIEGIFDDINNKISMPKKIYMSNNFELKFNADGQITSFDTFLYGKDDKGKLESYLISYNSNKSNKITVYLNGNVNADYNKDKVLEPLIKTMKVIPLKKTVSIWNKNQYGILYYGKRSFEYNTAGILNINEKGDIAPVMGATSEIKGYFVSVYVPGKENICTPFRYNLVEDLNKPNETDSLTEKTDKNTSNDSTKSNGTDKFYLSNKIGYSFEVTGAAAGSMAYSLNKTSDGGHTWNTINENPFSGELGVAAGITFLDDKLGFICLSKSGGRYGELFRTEDGGVSFQKVDIPVQNVTSSGGQTYNPFDFPEMPYAKDGSLSILIGQGSDGDYNGGCKALYQSSDNGKTWQYVKEVEAGS